MTEKRPRTVNIISEIEVVPASSGTVRSAGGNGKGGVSDRRSAIVPLPQVVQNVTEVGVDQLKAGVADATEALREMFAESFAAAFGAFELDEVEVSLQISADGKVGFMGSGVGLKGSSTIKLKFKRSDKSA